MKYIQNITLDVNCSPANFQYINAKQCDNASRALNVTLTSNNQKIKPETGTEAVFRCLKPDGNSCVNPAVINADVTITVEFTKQELAVKGVTLADISLIKNDTILSTVSFRILVDEAPVSVSKVKSSGEFLILLDTIKAAEEATQNANSATDKANKATTAANTAKKNADTAANNANSAANTVNEAKANADNAAEAASAAADSANEAAEKANSAADSANEAKENANSAADAANAAAERAENAVQDTERVINKATEAATEANTAANSAQTAADLVTSKLENGEFIGPQGEQGIQGEKGDDGFSPIITVAVSENGHNVTITDSTGDKSFDVLNGEQGLPGEDGKDYILTDADKKDIADLAVENAAEAADNANSAAQAVQDLIDAVNQKLANGEFNGADYNLTAADKTEIAKLVEPLAESMQGGTVTYEIPKEFYEGNIFAFDRNNTTDPNKTGINIYIPYIAFNLAEIVLDSERFDADLNSGLIEELPDEVYELPLDEQVPIFEEYFKDYITISQNPWCPNTIKPLLYYALANTEYMPLQQVFRNDIKIQMAIEREYTGEETIIVASPNFTSADDIAGTNIFYPIMLMQTDSGDNSEIIRFTIVILGSCPKYSSDSKYATANDTIKEVTFTFIPNNTFVEADKNESI